MEVAAGTIGLRVGRDKVLSQRPRRFAPQSSNRTVNGALRACRPFRPKW